MIVSCYSFKCTPPLLHSSFFPPLFLLFIFFLLYPRRPSIYLCLPSSLPITFLPSLFVFPFFFPFPLRSFLLTTTSLSNSRYTAPLISSPLHSFLHRSSFFFTPPFFRSFFSPSLHSYPLASLLLITPLLFSPLNRLWTRGYDVYTPSRNLIGHDYLSTMTATAPKLVDKEHFDELSPLEWAR